MTHAIMTHIKVLGAAAALALAVHSGAAQQRGKMFTVDGIDVILRPVSANQVVCADLFIKGGTSYLPGGESVATEGMALGVAAASGPADMTKDDYQRSLSRMVSSITGSAGRDYSTFSMLCVKEHFDDTWNLFAGVVLSPKFDSVEFVRSKKNKIMAIKSIPSNPDAYVQYLADSVYFQGHPYSRTPTVEEVQALTADQLQTHFRELFVKKRLLLVVVGNVTESDLRGKIERTLGTLPEGTYTAPEVSVPENASSPHFVAVQSDIPTTYILGYFNAPVRTSSDYWPAIIAGETLSDRLFVEVRTKRNLSYAPAAGLDPNRTPNGYLYVTTTLPDSALSVMFHCVDSLQKYPVSHEELKGEEAQFITGVIARNETNETQASILGIYQLLAGSWEKADQVVQTIQKVTPEQIRAAANKYVHNITFAVVGDANKCDKALFESR